MDARKGARRHLYAKGNERAYNGLYLRGVLRGNLARGNVGTDNAGHQDPEPVAMIRGDQLAKIDKNGKFPFWGVSIVNNNKKTMETIEKRLKIIS